MGTTRVQLDAMNMLILYIIRSTAKHVHLSFTCIYMHPFIPEGNNPQATFQPVAYSPHSQAVEPGLTPLWRHVKHPVRSLQGEMAKLVAHVWYVIYRLIFLCLHPTGKKQACARIALVMLMYLNYMFLIK